MKLHLPVRLFKSVLACLAAVASFSLSSGVAWAEVQNLIFNGTTLTWDTSEDNKPFVDEEDAAASFAAGDNVSFTSESTVTLGEDVAAGTVAIEKDADVTIDLGEFELDVARIELSGTLDMGDSLSIGKGDALAMTGAGAVLDSNLVLGEKGLLSVTGAGGSLNGHSLTLQEGASLILTGAVLSRETIDANGDGGLSLIVIPTGDGKTYTLLTGISSLLDKNGDTLAAGSYSVNDYFDKTAPGSGFWADATLVYTADGMLQIVRHGETVKESLEITEQQTGTQDYSYYKSILFNDIFSSSPGSAIYGGSDSTIKLSNNGSVVFEGNTASSSYAYGGAIYGRSNSSITLSHNGSVTFSGNTASGLSSAYGGAIYDNGTITLSHNGSVTFSGNTASGSLYSNGGAICEWSNSSITLSNNGSVSFSGNTASGSSSVSGGAIYGGSTLSHNGSVTFSGNTASSGSDDAYGGAIYRGSTLSNNGSVTFSGNTASGSDYAYGGAIYGGSTLSNNGSVTFSGNTASSGSDYAYGGAINGGTITLSNNGSVTFSGNTASGSGGAEGGAIWGGITLINNGSVTFSGNTASGSYFVYGGAIYKKYGIFSIQNNDSVVFEKNYTLQKGTLRLQSIYACDWEDAGKEMLVNFSAPKGGKIEFRDSIDIVVNRSSVSAFHLNNWYVDDAGEKVAQTGDIIFTGEDATAENLKAILAAHGINREATADEIRLSKTSEVWGTMQLHDGRLIVRDGAIIEAAGITVHGSASGESTPTLWLDNGALRSVSNAENVVSISGDGALRLSGQNTARYSALTLSAGSTFIIDVAAAHTTTAALTLNSSTLSLGGTITLQLNAAEGLNTAGRYMLLSGVSAPTDWASNITVSGGVWTIDDLSWVNNILYLNFPTLTEATWNNQSGDRLWNVNSSVNWEQHDIDYAYKDGIGVIFGDEGAGKVTLEGELAPGSVLVNNAAGQDYTFEGSGSLTGNMKLTKKGAGNLTICTANIYSGGTEIDNSRLTITHTNALGTGAIETRGNSSLEVKGVTLALGSTINHSATGTLSLSGNIDASALEKSDSDDVFVDVYGAETKNGSGFVRSGDFTVTVVDEGTVDSSAATITWNGTSLTMNNGVGSAKGSMLYGTYRILTGHTASSTAIHGYDNGAGANAVVTLVAGGTLNADDANGVNVTATGGTINLSAGALSGTWANVSVTATGGSLAGSFDGISTLAGTGFVLGNTAVQNNGTLTLSGSFDASGLVSTATGKDMFVDTSNNVTGNGSGFRRTEDFTVLVATGTVDSSNAVVTYGGQTLTMTGGTGFGVGEVKYDTYLLQGNDTATVSKIATMAGEALQKIDMQGGTLNVNASTDKLVATGGSIQLSAGTLGGSIGGTAAVAVIGTATISGNNSYTGGTALSNGNLTITHAKALGTGSISAEGTSSLIVGSGATLALGSVISNSGTLALSGSFDASALAKSESDDIYVALNGTEEKNGSGFLRSGDFSVLVVNGGTVDSTAATITWYGTALEMTGGTGFAAGAMHYDTYRILSGHTADALAIHQYHADSANAKVALATGGTLNANDANGVEVSANGGTINLTAGALSGTWTNASVNATGGSLAGSFEGTSTLEGSNGFNLGSAAVQNSGTLTLKGSFDASGMTTTLTNVDMRVDENGIVSRDGSGFLRTGDFEVLVATGTVDSTNAEVTYGGQTLTMTGGTGFGVGEVKYDTYLLQGNDTATVSKIATMAGEALQKIDMQGGTLNVNASTDKLVATGGSIQLSAGTLGGSIGGTAAVAVIGTATISGNNSYTGGTALSNGNLTITHAKALGTGSISAEGTSSLIVGSGATLALDEVIANTGTLALSGSFDASALQLNKTEAGRLTLSGERVGLTESGFSQGVAYSVQLVNGGKSVADGLSIHHDDFLMRTQLVLDEDGVARAGGAVDYTHFFLTGGDSAVVSEIADVSAQHQETLAGVTMDSGELEVDRSIAVNATGGSIDITKAATLSGAIEDTAVSTAAGDYSSEIAALLKGDTTLEVNGGAVTVSGDNSYSGGTVVNGGSLLAGHDKAFGSGDVAVNGVTLDLNRFTIANKVLMNGNSTLGHADGAAHIVLGGGSKVNFRDGYTLSAGKVLEVASPGATYTGALTLGGGTLELDGLLTVQGDVTFESGTQTTIDISGWNGADDGEVLATLGSSNSGYTEESLKLAGIAGDWELDFDAATGVLTLVAVKDEPLPEPEFNPNLNRNQQIVYDTIKDIMGEGNPGGLLGELGKEVIGTRDEEKLKQLLDELGGAEYATLLSGQQAAARGHMRRLRGEMGCGHLLAGSKTRAYIEAYNHRSEVDGDAHGRGYELNESGGQFALEFLGEDSVSGGFAVAAGRSKLQPDGGMTQKSDNTYVDAFVMHRDGAYTGKFSLGVGVHKYDLDRRVAGNAVSADTSGSSVNFMHESAWAMSLSESHSVQVFGAVESSFNRLGAFHEKGADTASLQVESQDAWVTTLSLGARYLYSFAALESAPAATLSLQGGLELDFGDTDSEVEMNFEGARSHSFRQSGAERDTFGYNLGASLHLPVSAKAAIYASGDAVLRGDSYEVNANVGLQMAF